jgi:hypothetical protein
MRWYNAAMLAISIGPGDLRVVFVPTAVILAVI